MNWVEGLSYLSNASAFVTGVAAVMAYTLWETEDRERFPTAMKALWVSLGCAILFGFLSVVCN